MKLPTTSSLILFIFCFIVGGVISAASDLETSPGAYEFGSLLLLASPFAFFGAALARISRKVAFILIAIGAVTFTIGAIIVYNEPEGILTPFIVIAGAGFVLGPVAHLILDRSRPAPERKSVGETD